MLLVIACEGLPPPEDAHQDDDVVVGDVGLRHPGLEARPLIIFEIVVVGQSHHVDVLAELDVPDAVLLEDQLNLVRLGVAEVEGGHDLPFPKALQEVRCRLGAAALCPRRSQVQFSEIADERLEPGDSQLEFSQVALRVKPVAGSLGRLFGGRIDLVVPAIELG